MFRISKRLLRRRSATGSGDDITKVRDLRRPKDVGGPMQHEGSTVQLSLSLREPTNIYFGLGSITHLTFPSRFASRLSVRRWNTLRLSHSWLGGASVAEGPQRTRLYTHLGRLR